MTIDIGNKRIYADGYIANPNDLSIQFYREKSDLDYIPPIKVSENMLSDYGRGVLEKGNDKRRSVKMVDNRENGNDA